MRNREGFGEIKVGARGVALALVETVVTFATKPFAEAANLGTYSKRGLYLLGAIVAGVSAILWLQPALRTPLSDSNTLARSIYKALGERNGVFKVIPANYLPLALLPLVVYVALAFWPRGRNAAGEHTANAIFSLLNRSITLAEWCIEHRWHSLTFFFLLTATVAMLVTNLVNNAFAAHTLHDDFNYWLNDVDNFIAANPVTRPEPDAYARVNSAWRREFGRLATRDPNTTHPGLCLHEMLDELYLERTSQPWRAVLQKKVNVLRDDLSRCNSNSSLKLDGEEQRASALANLLMARVYVRLSDDLDSAPDTYRNLANAVQLFSTVARLNNQAKSYKSDGENGQGTVYARALAAYAEHPAQTSDARSTLATLCVGPAQCASLALQNYELAGAGWDPCSYRNKRQRNNTTDLLILIGKNYKQLEISLAGDPFGDWTQSPAALADQIEQHLRDLMLCNSNDAFLPPFAITAAEGLAVSAQLRRQAGQDGTADLVAAARYLRFANSFEPHNVPEWDYSYYCFAAPNGLVEPAFRDALTASSDALPNANRIVQMLSRKCR
jgi:hypothetical protein